MVKRFLLAVLLALLVAVPASAAYIDMAQSKAGAAIVVDSSVTTSDYIRTPARGFQRLSFTLGSAFAATVYTCETSTYSGTTCSSAATLSTTNPKIDIKTGRRWLVIDVTTAETGTNLSYISIQSNPDNAGAGGGGGVEVVTQADLANPGSQDVIYQVTDATDTSDCATGTPGSATAFCGWNGSAYVAVGVAATGLTNPLAANLDANNKSISNMLALGTRNYYVRTQAQLEAALALCNDVDANGIGADEFTGCGIVAEGGEIAISTTVELCGSGSAATGCNGLRFFGLGGGLQNNTNHYSNSGTVFRWTGAAGGTMFTLGACNNCEFAHFMLEGDNNVTPGNDAAILWDVLAPSSTSTKFETHHIGMSGATSYAIRLPASGQVDESTFHHMALTYNAACYQQRASQSVGIQLGPNFVCTLNTGTGPFMKIDAGSLIVTNSYCGIVAGSSTCLSFGEVANNLVIENSQFEGYGYASPLFIDADSGTYSSVQRISIRNNQFVIDASSTSGVAFDYYGRGTVEWESNNYVATSGTPGLAVTIDVPTGQKLQVATKANTYNQGSEPAFRWLPTIDTEAIVNSPVLAMNGTLLTPCGWWEVGRNTAGTSGEQLYNCESGTWTQQKAAAAISVNGSPAVSTGGDLTSGLWHDIAADANPFNNATLDPIFSNTWATINNVAGIAEQCGFTISGNGSGGFLCEGGTANTTDHYFTFSGVTDSGADAERFIPLSTAGFTVTPGTSQCARFDSSGNLVAATGDCNAAASVTGNLDLGTGTIKGSVPVQATSSTAYTLTTARGDFVMADESGATQIELPALASGSNFCVYSATAQVISLNPNGTETIYLDGASIGAGDELDSPGALGDFVCLLSNGTNWYVIGKAGTWIDGGAT